MKRMGIQFRRRFPLHLSGVREAIEKNVQLAFYDRKIFLDVWNARNRLNYLPLKKDAPLEFTPSNPLIALVASDQAIRIFHGNRRVTNLYPEYFHYDSSISGISMRIDGYHRQVEFGERVHVGQTFRVTPLPGYRVNIIGFRKGAPGGEAGIDIRHEDIEKRFSLDKDGMLFRVEVYRQERFSGMVLVQFGDLPAPLHRTSPRGIAPPETQPAHERPITRRGVQEASEEFGR
jgi:hypothetical protein